MRLIDPPSRAFGSNKEWIEFWQEMRRYPDDESAVDWKEKAEHELVLRGVDIKRLSDA